MKKKHLKLDLRIKRLGNQLVQFISVVHFTFYLLHNIRLLSLKFTSRSAARWQLGIKKAFHRAA
jgi:hypothetical protein